MKLIEYKNEDGTFLLYPNDAISQDLLRGNIWERHFKIIVETIMPKDRDALDCGANFGYNAIVMGKNLNEKAKLICFEPQSLVFEQLIQNLKLNDIKNVECYKNCLDSISNKSVSLNFVDYSSSWVNIGDTSVGAGGEECTTIAIDDMNLTDVGFMKIDVQGYELNVLKGAERTITEHNPIVFIELEEHQLVKFNLKINDV
jgi:FkbM family methyltransferase